MKQVSAYLTSDGKLFETKDLALAERHEYMLIKSDVVNSFLNSPSNNYKGVPQRAIAQNTIMNWELWKVKNGIE